MVLGLRSTVWEHLCGKKEALESTSVGRREALVGTVKSMLKLSMTGNTSPWS